MGQRSHNPFSNRSPTVGKPFTNLPLTALHLRESHNLYNVH